MHLALRLWLRMTTRGYVSRGRRPCFGESISEARGGVGVGEADLGRWEPFVPHEAAELLDRLAVPWWIAGGWAIDLFLGRRTRDHEDLDVGLLLRDQLAVQATLSGWDLHPAGGGVLRPWPPGENLPPDVHDVWCRPAPNAPWALQFMLNEAEGEDWLFRRDPGVRRPLAEIVLRDRDGLPFLAPEVQLLFKSKQPRPKDEADFAAVLPYLDEGRRRWLSEVLARVQPGHPWIARSYHRRVYPPAAE